MIDVIFHDSGKRSTEKSDPEYPNGVPINLATVIQKSCTRNLPYPAPRCGHYAVQCQVCGFAAILTVAGRPDDPKTVTMPCKTKGLNS